MDLIVEFGFTSTDMHQTCLVWGSQTGQAFVEKLQTAGLELGFLAPGFDKWTEVVQALTLVKNGRSCKSGLTDPIFFANLPVFFVFSIVFTFLASPELWK